MLKPIGPIPTIDPGMTLDSLIKQLTALRDSGIDGQHGIAVSVVGEDDNFTTTKIQCCGLATIDDVTKPCVLFAIMREPQLFAPCDHVTVNETV